MLPMVSIITPCLNAAAHIRPTMQSILGQSGEFVLQWIVIDGGSTDGTLEILHNCRDSRLKLISQKDGGQSAAINHGLRFAEGQIIGWLNADDLYTSGAVQTVVRAFTENPQSPWLVGRCQMIDSSGKKTRPAITSYKDKLLNAYTRTKLLRINMISQPAVFWRADFGRDIGQLDETLHWTMDYDLWLRMSTRCDPLILPDIVGEFRVHESSKSAGGNRPQFAEEYRVACRYTGTDQLSRWLHRLNMEKVVWGYRLLRFFSRSQKGAATVSRKAC